MIAIDPTPTTIIKIAQKRKKYIGCGDEEKLLELVELVNEEVALAKQSRATRTGMLGSMWSSMIAKRAPPSPNEPARRPMIVP
jgi:hypothetical protein